MLSRLTRIPIRSFCFSSSKFSSLLYSNRQQSLSEAALMLVQIEQQQKSLKAQIEQYKAEIVDYQQNSNQERIKRLLKAHKQIQNNNQFQLQRIRKQMWTTNKYALTRMAKEVLEVADNLKRCINQLNNSGKSNENLNEGLEVLSQLFALNDIKEFDPTGEKFNPHTSEAVSVIIDESKEEDVVGKTSQVGYMIHDRILRSAKVGVVQKSKEKGKKV